VTEATCGTVSIPRLILPRNPARRELLLGEAILLWGAYLEALQVGAEDARTSRYHVSRYMPIPVAAASAWTPYPNPPGATASPSPLEE